MKRKYLKENQFYIVDAQNQNIGRLATRIASILIGKHKSTFLYNEDSGDFVVVINASKVSISGRKIDQKIYRYHSGRPGGMKVKTFKEIQKTKPEQLIEKAVKGMLPKGPLGRSIFKKLRVKSSVNYIKKFKQEIYFQSESTSNYFDFFSKI
jgi:large subunit ribosomal protein L13